jgi:hypothetical protein
LTSRLKLRDGFLVAFLRPYLARKRELVRGEAQSFATDV